ncbi:MAG: type I phosphomannose isomerase catalytic subunit [Verrucomicrobiota bacterium]
MLYPLTFHPIFKERIWGGRNIERLYHKVLPPNIPIGESWEISDRTEDQSVVANGALAGKSIHWLMENHRQELLGPAQTASENRFPLLIKILDAKEKLSLQVHPPADKAAELGGEAKSEMWYVADATPDADLFVGLKSGVTRAEFEKHIYDGTVAKCFHHVPVKKGDAMFLPSGRVHAIGAGNVIFEIQQNSDTTYRVFDWNRVDASGKPRQLHIEKSLASINFEDFDPPLAGKKTESHDGLKIRLLANDDSFSVDLLQAEAGKKIETKTGEMEILGVVEGKLSVHFDNQILSLSAGQFCLFPARAMPFEVVAEKAVSFLKIHAG